MLKTPGLFLFVVTFLVAPRCNEASVAMTVLTSQGYRYVTFPTNYFNKFYKCLCDNKKTCTAEYYINVWNNRYVDNVVVGVADTAGNSGSSINYYCYYNGWLTITCEKKNSNVGGYHHWYEVHETECHYPCLVFIWYDSGERIDFSDSELNVQRCYGSDCVCPVPTTTPITQTTTEKATTTTASTTTSTTTRPKSTTATSVTTESVDSTSAAAVPNSANDSNDDPQLSVIIGVVFAAIFIVIVIAVISFIFWRRKRIHRTSKPHNDSIALNELSNNVNSVPENRLTGTHNNVASVSNNYSEIDGNKPDVSSDNDHDKYAKGIYQNSVNETKSSFPTPKNGNKKTAKTPTVSELKGNKTLPAGNGQTQTKSQFVPGNDQEENAMTSSQDVEYGYSTVQDQSTGHDDYHPAAVTQYDYATVMNSKNEDTGYEYAGPDDVHVTDTANKSGIDNEDSNVYSTAGNINNSIASPSAIHPKGIYSRLHEESRQIQNPYNTLLQPTEDAHVSQTANQPSRYSFAQPISGQASNENADSSEKTSKTATSQNHTYYVLEGGEENGETTTKKRNTYFELEKQENFSDSNTEEA